MGCRTPRAGRIAHSREHDEGASFHTLRHTAGFWAAQAGESGPVIARVLGQWPPTMTERYLHLNPDHFRGIVSALDGAEQGRATQTATCSENGLDTSQAHVVS